MSIPTGRPIVPGTIDDSIATVTYGVPKPTTKGLSRLSFECDGEVLNMRYAPKDVTYEMDIDDWTEQTRPGKKSLLVTGAKRLKKMSMSLTLAEGNDRSANVNAYITTLQEFASNPNPVNVFYDFYAMADNGWRITNMSVQAVEREPGSPEDRSSEITRAIVTLELTEWVSTKLNVAANGGVPDINTKKPYVVKGNVNTYFRIAQAKYNDLSYAVKLKDLKKNKPLKVKHVDDTIPAGSKVWLVAW